MLKFFYILFFLLLSSNLNANESLLTIQQQLERLQREVSDISKSIYSNSDNLENNIDSNVVSNLSAIDMRIYDLEKDVQNLTLNLEEIFFKLDDVFNKIDNFQILIDDLDNRIVENQNTVNETPAQNDINDSTDQNTLGSLKITKLDKNIEDNDQTIKNDNNLKSSLKLSAEDQFQAAFDNIREKKWSDAKNSFIDFISENPDNQLAGSAHYWLGELYILEKKYRDAALIFAEGYQKYPKSIKAPDMLHKLSISLFEVEKNIEGCNTLQKFIEDYPEHKLSSKSKKLLLNNECSLASE